MARNKNSALRQVIDSSPEMILPMLEKLYERVSVSEAGCHEASGSANAGYPAVTIPIIGGQILGSHLVWRAVKGEWPTMLMLHKCDNKACVNPDHLYDGNDKDNTRDRIFNTPFHERMHWPGVER